MREKILKEVHDASLAMEQMKTEQGLFFISEAAQIISTTFQKDKKILLAGNGGSLCDAMHFAEELTGYFRKPRKALPAIVFSEPGHMSCVSNDVGYDYVFTRGLEALGQEGDVFIALTTSGNSRNLLLALEKAKEKKIQTIAFLGKGGGKMKGLSDLEWIVEGFTTSDRIQEAHMAAIHIIIHLVETLLFQEKMCLSGWARR